VLSKAATMCPPMIFGDDSIEGCTDSSSTIAPSQTNGRCTIIPEQSPSSLKADPE
jgi:hypothetical protein